MAPAAPATNPGHGESSSDGRRRRAQRTVSRRALLQLLIGVLVVGVTPVVATVHILDSNALENERARADSALRGELQGASERLGQLADDASNRGDDLAQSSELQHAFIAGDRTTIRRIAAQNAGVLFYLRRQRVAGKGPAHARAERGRNQPLRAPPGEGNRGERASLPATHPLRGARILCAARPRRPRLRAADPEHARRLPQSRLASGDRQPDWPREPTLVRRRARPRMAPRGTRR